MRFFPPWARWMTAVVVMTMGLAAFASAQRGGGGFRGFEMAFEPNIRNVKYDGRFTFARLKYTVGSGGYYYHGMPAWAHGLIPVQGSKDPAEHNLMNILDSISAVHPRIDESNVFALDDPELFKFPVSYMTEAGFWELNDKEASSFRAYLQKGGFVIFDDFRDPPRGGGGWANFEYNMRRILPGAQMVDLTPEHPIFHSFFDIDSFDVIPQAYDRDNTGRLLRPVIRGIYEDNDPNKRLMAIINFDTDVSEYWEFSSTGLMPVSDSNEAYELGVNYIIYGLTH